MPYPLKLSWKTEIVPLFCTLAAWPLGLYFYAHFPERVATHWNLAGQVDGWSSRGLGAFLFPALLTLFYVLFLVLPVWDIERKRYAEFGAAYAIIRSSITVLFFLLFVALGLFNIGYAIDVGKLAPFLIGLAFIVLGFALKRVKRNWFVGIRTPWTLSSEAVWNRTHHVGGLVFMAFGAFVAVTPLLPMAATIWGFLFGLLAMVLGLAAYSYVLFQREKRKN